MVSVSPPPIHKHPHLAPRTRSHSREHEDRDVFAWRKVNYTVLVQENHLFWLTIRLMPSIRDMSCHDIVVKIVELHHATGEYKEGDSVIIQRVLGKTFKGIFAWLVRGARQFYKGF